MTSLSDRVQAAVDLLADRLQQARHRNGYWCGCLSSSALATATAASAFALAGREADRRRLESACQWLRVHANPDGGWGDTPDSPSNPATTLLTLAALRLAQKAGSDVSRETEAAATGWLTRWAGPMPADWTRALLDAYGQDRTFAVPILTNCALAGLVDWRAIPPLPFEMAALPRSLLKGLRLQVVSYALPALIAIGRLLHKRAPSRDPLVRLLRSGCFRSVLHRLAEVQPESGGYLEAIPLTAFVVMSLVGAGDGDHPVAEKGLSFLRETMRDDGSWPIDVDLATWVTSQAASALAHAGRPVAPATRAYLLQGQGRGIHPYTGAAPGGWAWTHRSGGVPDADDTSAALLALGQGPDAPADTVRAGLRWLLDLRNPDGGWPTFCRGWNRLPFDQSAPELTAHVLQALMRWEHLGPTQAIGTARLRGLKYLQRTQQADGSWLPLWFGNQHAPRKANPVYGTARVLGGLAVVCRRDDGGPGGSDLRDALQCAEQYLLAAQNADGGWGGAPGVASTVEETAVALDCLCRVGSGPQERLRAACAFLCERVEQDDLAPSPIGLYFSSLWYGEELYPQVWTLAALATYLHGRQDSG